MLQRKEASTIFLPKKLLEEKLLKFLEEDLGQSDVTTALLIPEGITVEAEVVAKEAGIIAGIEEALTLLETFHLEASALVSEGSKVDGKTVVLKIVGDARTLLSIERTLLNLLSRMSGIATATNRLMEKVKQAGYKTRIAATRKVAVGLEYFDKKAVLLGGGDPHRFHLDDLVLIKDNHLAIVGNLSEAVKKAKEKVSFTKKIEVEVTCAEEAVEAAKAGVDIIMLDNMKPKQISEALAMLQKENLRGKVLVEASGGITEQNILDYAATGVDIISLSEITDAVKSLDISLEVRKLKKPSKKRI
ncbi:MAG: carboxylating nicotinate-nucleotide diphosphorylase [Candidatus Bathyarchaeia archaeon]